jgi:hypothetical protein
MIKVDQAKIAVIGLGYVGLPLAVEFGKHFPNSALPPMRRRWNPVTSISSPFPPPSISTSVRICAP